VRRRAAGNKPATRTLEPPEHAIISGFWEGAMSVIDFFEYLASNGDTVDLAHELADVWVAHQIADVYEPAA